MRSLGFEFKRAFLSLRDQRLHPMPDRWFALYWLMRPYNLTVRKWRDFLHLRRPDDTPSSHHKPS